jgi:hypothetical protein
MVLPISRDTTSAVLERLRLDPPLCRKDVETTQNLLRLMKLKYPIGTFGRTDNELKRVCALVEYVAREEGGHRISMDQLAKVAVMKKKDFVAFHEIVGNFKENSTTSRSTVPSSSSTTTTSLSSSLQSTTVNNLVAGSGSISGTNRKGGHSDTTTTIVLPNSTTIPSLVMQLGVFLPNSNIVAVEAQRLFQQIVSHLQHNKKSRERISGLEDIRTNQTTYEAVCFYLTATKDKHRTNNPNGRASTSNGRGGGSRHRPSQQQQQHHHQQQQRTSSSHPDGGGGGDTFFDKQLDLSTFLDVCAKDFTRSQFQMILEYVSELWEEIQYLPPDNLNGTVAAVASSLLSKRTVHNMSIGVEEKEQDDRHPQKAEQGSSRKRSRIGTNEQDVSSSTCTSDRKAATTTTDQLLTLIEQEQQQGGVEGSTKTWEDIINNSNNNKNDSIELSGMDQSGMEYSPFFLEWKKKVLTLACDNIRCAVEEQGKDTSTFHQTDPFNKNDTMLDCAAQEVLKRYKLLS